MKTADRSSGTRPARHPFLRKLAALTGFTLALTGIGFTAPAFAADGPLTVVSLTFDDGNADQLAAVNILNAAGMKGTFFVPSGYVDASGYLTRSQVVGVAAQGHEIGGHTVTHADLTSTSPTAAKLQVCEDRATLSSWGLNIRSFAYPFASVNTQAMNAVQACNYNSGRGLGDIASRFGCGDCYNAETLPPMSPFYTMALDQQDVSWTLDDLTSAVIRAEEAGGGWLQYTFHHVCNGCDSLSITPALLQQFVTWLAARGTTNNTVVRTVGDAVGGATKPVVASVLPPAPGPGVNAIVNPSLEIAGAGGLPHCWQTGGYGANTPAFSRVSPGRTGSFAEQLVMSGYSDGDAKLLPTLDLGECAPTVTPGHSYSLRAWYTSTVPTQFAVYLRSSVGTWVYWTSSPWFAAAAEYTHAYWDSAVIPAGYNGISFGLNLFSNGTLRTDDYSLYDTVGAPGALGDLVAITPTIIGTAKVGETLSANQGVWAPEGVGFSYQWRSNGTAISGATSASYTPAGADAGKRLSVSVTGTLTGYTPATGTSAQSAAVQHGDLTPGVPTISGTAEVGRTLTANPGSWVPSGTTFGYQWWRGSSPIPGATSVNYTATDADLGLTLSVQVTGSQLGYAPQSRMSGSTSTVTPGILTGPTPTITGNAVIGQTLTAVTGIWSPAPVTLSYQWMRDGSPIGAATSSTYRLAAADLATQITVEVRAEKVGYVATTSTSAPVVPTDLSPQAPTITGTAEVGRTLIAHPGDWGPNPVTFSYQWWSGSAQIVGATSASYTASPADVGLRLSVQVTGVSDGFLSATRMSLPTAPVTPAALASQKPTLSGTPRVGEILTVNAGTWTPAPVTLSYTWLRNGSVIAGATASSYTLTNADLNKKISVRVEGSKAGYVTKAVISSTTKKVKKAKKAKKRQPLTRLMRTS